MAYTEAVTDMDRQVLAHLGGSDVVYAPAAGASAIVKGLFYSAFLLASPGTAGGPGIESSAPAVFLPCLADLPTDPDVDAPTITVGGVSYTVRERHKDGMGGVVLFLREA